MKYTHLDAWAGGQGEEGGGERKEIDLKQDGRKASIRCFIKLFPGVGRWGSILLGPLRTILSRNEREKSFPGPRHQSVKDCPWGVNSSDIQVCTYVGMVKSMVVLAEALRQGRQTHISFCY